jgi:hypothetical protein
MRASFAAALVAAACAWDVASAASPPEVVTVTKPSFPPALARFAPSNDPGLRIVTTTARDPASLGVLEPEIIGGAFPKTLRDQDAGHVFFQPGTTLVVYGTGLIAGIGLRGGMRYAFDLRSFGFPPKALASEAYGPQEVSWAGQVGRTLVVQTNHLGYASDSGRRNGYLTGIDLDTGKVRWRSPALVANAQNFVVARGLIVSGYGFTAEKDWLYLVDPATGRVRDRLALPSMAERISRSGDRIVVRCYDARVVVRLV